MKTEQTILVWDLPVRVFHWLLVLSFCGAFITAKSERWMLVHITLGYTVAALVAVHVVAVLASSWLHKERLVPAMITGRKPGTPGEGITRAWRPLGVLVLVGVVGFWAWQWSAAPSALDKPASMASRHDDD